MPIELTGNQAQTACVVFQDDAWDISVEKGLVTGVGHFVPGRQVDPQLHHLQGAAAFGKTFGMELFVENAGSCGHPLHIAGADLAATAGGIAVFQFALVDDGHGFETPVRVLTHATSLGGRGEFSRPRVIQQQKRADVFGQVVVGKQRTDRKTVADPVHMRAGVDTDDVFHGVS